MSRYIFTLALLCLTVLALAQPASAQEADRPWEASITVVSDYRYHGVSLSGRDPALQAEVSYSHDSGFYAGAFASTVSDNGGDDIELDFDGGYAWVLPGLEVSLGAIAYVYPGADDANYAEAYVHVSHAVTETVRVGTEVRYAPDQNSFGTDNTYATVFAEWTVADDWTILTSVGQEDGYYDRKFDWNLGAEYDFGRAAVGLAWVGFDEAGFKEDAVVASFRLAY